MAQYAGSGMLNGYGESSSLVGLGPAVLRLALAAVFIAHGAQKLFGVWGGAGLSDASAHLADLGLTAAYPVTAVVGFVELAGGFFLLLGAFTLVVSALLAVDLLVAVWRVHAEGGFFLNWSMAAGQAHGVEFHVVLLAALVCLMASGPGTFSLDGRRASRAAAAAAGRARLRAGKV